MVICDFTYTFWQQCEVGLFFVFRFSFFVICFSFFVIRFSLFNFRFDIQNPILTFEIAPNIIFLHLKTYFDIRTKAEYRILTFKILFWHSNWVKYRILTFKILFWHSKSGRISYFDIQNPILTFEIRPNIVFCYSKSYFDIRTEAEYRILIFKILFWHSKSGRISYFDIQNPILTFENGPNIVFWHSKSYFDIRTEAEYRILTFKILFWHSNLGEVSHFHIQNPILTFELGPNIAF